MTAEKGTSTGLVVFVVQWLETFEVVKPVIRALHEIGWATKIVVMPEMDLMQLTSSGDAADMHLARQVWERLATEGYAPQPMIDPANEAARIQGWRPEAVFLPAPYDGHRPPSMAPQALQLPVHYVNYGFDLWPPELGGSIQFGLPFYRDCAAVYAENEFCAGEFVRAGVPAERVIPTGHPALDHWDSDHPRAVKPTVLWCPWWSTRILGEDGSVTVGYSTFHSTYEAMLDEAIRHPYMQFIFRPHPYLWSTLRKDALWSLAEERAFHARVASLDNISIQGDVTETMRYPVYPDHIRQFEDAWAMITDGVSFLAEFAYTGKPVLLTQAPGNPGWNRVGRAIEEMVDRSENAAGLGDFLDRIERDEEPDPRLRREAMKGLFYRPPQGSAAAIAQHIQSRFALSRP